MLSVEGIINVWIFHRLIHLEHKKFSIFFSGTSKSKIFSSTTLMKCLLELFIELRLRFMKSNRTPAIITADKKRD